MAGMNSHVNLSLTTDLHNQITTEAKTNEISRNAYIRQILKKRHILDYLPEIEELLIKLVEKSKHE